MRPGLGTEILTDDFSRASRWDIASSDEASAAIKNNRLTLSVQSEVYMLSLRNDLMLTDYYAEITARPSLCRNEDSYGLLAAVRLFQIRNTKSRPPAARGTPARSAAAAPCQWWWSWLPWPWSCP